MREHVPMQISVFLSATSYPSSAADWKGLFILRMLEALSRRDELSMQAWCPPGPLPPGVRDGFRGDDAEWLQGLASAGGIAHLLRNRPLRGLARSAGLLSRLKRALRASNADVLHINWLQNALALPADKRPALVTALGTDLQLLRLPGMRMLLRHALRRRPVAICPNAEWMLPALEHAFGDIAMIRTVQFGIDPQWYALERGFEANAVPKWLCISRLTEGKIGPLFEWTESFFSRGRAELHLFGPMQEQVDLPPWVHWHGPASPDVLREQWFPQAHGLITLSRHAEGRPQVMLEAMASGLPVVASLLPAHDDLLADGGGILCATSQDAMEALQALSVAGDNRAHGERGRARMRAEVGTWDDCAQRYATLYRELLDKPAT